jgi:hypothetical protein
MSNDGLLPSCWGQVMWHTLHSIAMAYVPTDQNKQQYFNFFTNLGYVLPCQACKTHYAQNVNTKTLMSSLDTQEGLFRWVYDLHNIVNKQTGVPESQWPSYETVKKTYENFKTSCSELPGICGSAEKTHKKIKVIEQFGSFNEDNLPYLICMIILIIMLIGCLGYIYTQRKKK